MTTLYLAGPYSARETLKGYRIEAIRIGYEVRARWLDGTHEIEDSTGAKASASDRAGWAQDDLEDIRDCDILIAFTSLLVAPGMGFSGGRHVETGYALGQRKSVILVGEPENVFHWLPGITRVPNWHEALIELAALAARRRLPKAAR